MFLPTVYIKSCVCGSAWALCWDECDSPRTWVRQGPSFTSTHKALWPCVLHGFTAKAASSCSNISGKDSAVNLTAKVTAALVRLGHCLVPCSSDKGTATCVPSQPVSLQAHITSACALSGTSFLAFCSYRDFSFMFGIQIWGSEEMEAESWFGFRFGAVKSPLDGIFMMWSIKHMLQCWGFKFLADRLTGSFHGTQMLWYTGII